MTVSAAVVDAPLEALLDRTANLVPKVQVFTTPGGTWSRPTNAKMVHCVLVSAGQNGAQTDFPYSGGSGGGAAGVIVEATLPATECPVEATVTVPANRAAGDAIVSATGWELRAKVNVNTNPTSSSGASPGTGGSGTISPAGGLYTGATSGGDGGGGVNGGTGGTGVTGGHGYMSAGGTGGAGGNGSSTFAGAGGAGGRGYGAGGGGAGGSYAAPYNGGGGGGGASGYGTAALATAGATGPTGLGTAAGGTGAPGVVIITSWCGGSPV